MKTDKEYEKIANDILTGQVESVNVYGKEYKIGLVLGSNYRIIINTLKEDVGQIDAIFVKQEYTSSFIKGLINFKTNDFSWCNIGAFYGYVSQTSRVAYDMLATHTPNNITDNGNKLNKRLQTEIDKLYVMQSEDRTDFMWKFNNGKIDKVTVNGKVYRVGKFGVPDIKPYTAPYRIIYKECGAFNVEFIALSDTLQFIEAHDVDKGFVKNRGTLVNYVSPVTITDMVTSTDTARIPAYEDVVEYSPFTDIYELEKYVGTTIRHKTSDFIILITGVISINNICLSAICKNITNEELFKYYEFLDGSKIGKKLYTRKYL